MIDAVECRRQIRVKSPEPFRVPSLDYLVNRLDRVVAATAGPEAVGLRLEPCLPFGLQCVFHPCLQHAISYHRDGRFILPLLSWRVGIFTFSGV